MKRSLILAGGGMKVAFQAGVLQVWLDEAGLQFDHVDACSGGCLNLAMLCNGMDGTTIAQQWRDYNAFDAIDLNWSAYLKFFHAESLFELDNFREKILTEWDLDFNKIQSYEQEATFNVYNFSKHQLEVIEPSQMSEDLLMASISLPMWFPPIEINGDKYIDSVFNTDANIEEAIARGADELWVIWTVSTLDEWDDGFVANYFQIIEAAANGRLDQSLKKIERNNAAIAAGEPSEYGRKITVKMLKSEVQMHYLLNFNGDRITEAVNAGVKKARNWCHEESIELSPQATELPTQVSSTQVSLKFSEVMKGFASVGATSYEEGLRTGKAAKNLLKVKLDVMVDNVDTFVTDPDHQALLNGSIYIDDDVHPIEKGWFNLFIDAGDPRQKYMSYLIHYRDGNDTACTFYGYKDIRDDPGFDLWEDTTTLFSSLYSGHLDKDQVDQQEPLSRGIIRIHMLDFIKQLTTFQTEGSTLANRLEAKLRFGRLFLGKLWDVYARGIFS